MVAVTNRAREIPMTMETGSLKVSDLHRAGRQAFIGIALDWELTPDEQRTLLGNMPPEDFETMLREPDYTFNPEQLERVSYIMGIHKALRILPIGRDKDNLRRWLRAPQRREYAPLFDGNSALHKMLNGDLTDLAAVRYYLDTLLT